MVNIYTTAFATGTLMIYFKKLLIEIKIYHFDAVCLVVDLDIG